MLGGKAVTKLIPEDEIRGEEYVTTLYENDPSRKLILGGEDRSASHLRYFNVCGSYLPSTPCAWHTDGGVRMGLTLRELERLDGGPFLIGSWQIDFSPA